MFYFAARHHIDLMPATDYADAPFLPPSFLRPRHSRHISPSPLLIFMPRRSRSIFADDIAARCCHAALAKRARHAVRYAFAALLRDELLIMPPAAIAPLPFFSIARPPFSPAPPFSL
jgi:hypothetical protein